MAVVSTVSARMGKGQTVLAGKNAVTLNFWKDDQELEDGSRVKSTSCLYRGPDFSLQHPHGSARGSDTLSGICRYQAQKWFTYM